MTANRLIIAFAVLAVAVALWLVATRPGGREGAAPAPAPAGAGSPEGSAGGGPAATVPEPPEQDPRFGTDPERHHLPERAVDTDDIPNIVLRAGDRDDEPLPYYRIAPDTYMLYGNIAEVDRYNRGFNGNAGFVVTPEGVVVIDALGTPKLGRRLIATIRQVTGAPIRYLILTHNHPDHSYGAVAFRRLGGVTIVAHEGTLDYLASEALERSVAYRRSFIPEDMEGFEAVVPDVLLGGAPRRARLVIRLGGRTFEVWDVNRHHSYGDLVVHQVEDGVVWISDLAFNHRLTFMGDGSLHAAIKAQDWLLERFAGARLMVPGHGSAQSPPFAMVRRTRDYMRALQDFMTRAVEEGLDLQDAVERAEKDPRFEPWRGDRLFELNHRPNANFVYREVERALFED